MYAMTFQFRPRGRSLNTYLTMIRRPMNWKLLKRSHFSQDFVLDGRVFDDSQNSLYIVLFVMNV